MSKKPKGVAALKKDLWTVFAKYCKYTRHADGYVNCFTCDANLQIGTSNCQLGHWLPKGGYPYHYFNEDNVRPQCYHCNINLSGNSEVFRRRLIDEIGIDRLNEIYDTRHTLEKRSAGWYSDKIADYKDKLHELLGHDSFTVR